MTENTNNEHAMRVAAYNQNHQAFRSLNQQMWQIPLISMTLTGGLWFGLSRVEDQRLFQMALLLLAFIGNTALIVVIHRLRFVMEKYLDWLKAEFREGHVEPLGKRWYQKSFVVRTSFQVMLGLTALVSLLLFGVTAWQTDWREALRRMPETAAVAFYESHARNLADGYEAVSLEAAHPALVNILNTEFANQTLDVLDVGAGTGRDAAWLASRGHNVVAVEPSLAMQNIGIRLHADAAIEWRLDRLPGLDITLDSGEAFDLVILSAVWMHVAPEDRPEAMQTLASLLKPNGVLYLTLRLGPEEPERGIHSVSLEDVTQLAQSLSLDVQELDEQEDLLGRRTITWQTLRIARP